MLTCPALEDIAAAGAADRELGHILGFLFIFLSENGLKESWEGFKNVPGGHRNQYRAGITTRATGMPMAISRISSPSSWPSEHSDPALADGSEGQKEHVATCALKRFSYA